MIISDALYRFEYEVRARSVWEAMRHTRDESDVFAACERVATLCQNVASGVERDSAAFSIAETEVQDAVDAAARQHVGLDGNTDHFTCAAKSAMAAATCPGVSGTSDSVDYAIESAGNASEEATVRLMGSIREAAAHIFDAATKEAIISAMREKWRRENEQWRTENERAKEQP